MVLTENAITGWYPVYIALVSNPPRYQAHVYIALVSNPPRYQAHAYIALIYSLTHSM